MILLKKLYLYLSFFKAKVKNLEQSLSKADDENSCLKDQIKKHLDNKKTLQDTITQLQTENEKVTDLLAFKTKESETFKLEISKLESKVSLFERDNQEKYNNITALNEDIKSAKENYDVSYSVQLLYV